MSRAYFSFFFSIAAMLMCGGFLVHAADDGLDFNLFASNMDDSTHAETYSDCQKGKNALASGDALLAVDFFREYLNKTKLAGDNAAMEDAYDLLLNACIIANLSEQAEEYLAEYEKLVPDKQLYHKFCKIEICFLQKRFDDAKRLIAEMRDVISNDSSHPFFSKFNLYDAYLLEHDGNFTQAIGKFDIIIKDLGRKRGFGAKASEHKMLLLVQLSRIDEAERELAAWFTEKSSLNSTVSEVELDSNQLFQFYCNLKRENKQTLSDKLSQEWLKISDLRHRNDFFYSVSLKIAEFFQEKKDYVHLTSAYSMAFHSALLKDDSLMLVDKLLQSYRKISDKKSAAEFAEQMLDYFQYSELPHDVRMQLADLLFQGKLVERGLKLCQDICSLEKNDRATCRKLVDTMVRAEEYESAHALIDYIVTVDSEYLLDALMEHARVYEISGDFQKAIDAYSNLLKKNELATEKREEVLTSLVNCHWKMEDYPHVIQEAKQLLQLNAKRQDIRFILAEAYEHANDKLSAYMSFSDFAEIASADAGETERLVYALYHMGVLSVSLGKPDQAVKAFKKLCSVQPRPSIYEKAMYLQIQTLFQTGESIEAENLTRDFRREYPASKFAYLSVLKAARHFYSSNEFERAESLLNELKDGTNFPDIRSEAWYLSARIAFKRNDLEAAMDVANRILKSTEGKNDPSSVLLRGVAAWIRGEVYRYSKSYDKAKTEYQQAISIAPNTVIAQIASGSYADCCFQQTAENNNPSAKVHSAIKVDVLENPNANQAEQSVSPYKTVLSEYAKILTISNLTLENEAVVTYKAAKTSELAGDYPAMQTYLRTLFSLVKPEEAPLHPVEAYWITKGALLAEDFFNAFPTADSIYVAESAINWLFITGKISAETAKARKKVLSAKIIPNVSQTQK